MKKSYIEKTNFIISNKNYEIAKLKKGTITLREMVYYLFIITVLLGFLIFLLSLGIVWLL